jgi:hypothetical protein
MGEMFRCPNCKEIIRIGADSCSYCSAPIDGRLALLEAQKFKAGVDACAAANIIKSANVGAPLLLGLQVYFFFDPSEWRMRSFLLPVGALAGAIGWFVKYGGLRTDDPDFPEAKQAVKKSLLLWAATTIVSLALLLLSR